MIESLPSDIQHFIQAQVSAGKYSSEADVVIEAVKLLRDQEENYQRFRAEVQRRLKSLDEGNYIELNGDEELAQFFDGLLQEVQVKHEVKHKVRSMD
ncbi:MAG: type II toxin-antitoxin system ParD family antitoxin [Pirellulales bacterium]